VSLKVIGTSPKTITYYGRHIHTCYEIILTVEGSGIFTVNNVEYPFCEGSIHIVPPNTPHVKSSEQGFKDIFFHCDDAVFSSICGPRNEIVSFEDDGERSLTALIKMMLYKFTSSNKNDRTLTLMYELFIRLITERCASGKADPVSESISRYLALNFNEPELSLSKVLTDTGYNKDYVRRRFIAAYGVTPGQYLTNLRIENAKKLLRQRKESGDSIADIGAMCGYYDGHYFSKIFKKQVGVEPREYASDGLKEENQ